MKKFKLVSSVYLSSFEDRVNYLLSEGYTPYGDPFSRNNSYCLCMIKEDIKDEPQEYSAT